MNSGKEDAAASANNGQPIDEPLFASLAGVKGLLITTLILVSVIALLDLPLFLKVILLCLVAFGAIWATSQTVYDEQTAARQWADPTDRLQALTGERLAEILSDALIVFDRSGVVLFVNSAAKDAFQSLQEGTALYLRFRAPEMHALIQGVIADGEPRSIDYFERVPIDHWYKAMVKRLHTDEDEQPLYIMVFRDHSEARRIDRMRSDFVANASHELRTPLASLRGFIETLQGPAKNDHAAQERFLTIMQKQAERMSRLIDDLLSLSRLEMRAQPTASESVDLSAVLHHVTDTLAPLAQDSGVEIECSVPDHPVMVTGARDELIQIFQNLVENACKYGQQGKRVIVKLEEPTADGAEIVASVQDFGPGIAGEHLPRLTERFYRIDVETSRAHKGTGLGLAIVKHVLTRHRGRLVIRSQIGEGSTFIVRLPKREN